MRRTQAHRDVRMIKFVTLDDARSEINSAFLDEEGTASTFRGLLEVFQRYGLPRSLYADH